jgi:hypothetical protein
MALPISNCVGQHVRTCDFFTSSLRRSKSSVIESAADDLPRPQYRRP